MQCPFAVHGSSRRRSKRPDQIEKQIVGIFKPDRKPQQIAGARRAGAFDRGAMLDQAFDAAERCRALPDLDAGRDARSPRLRRL